MAAGAVVRAAARRRCSRITRAVTRGAGRSGWRRRREFWRRLHDNLGGRRRHISGSGFLRGGPASAHPRDDHKANARNYATLSESHFLHIFSWVQPSLRAEPAILTDTLDLPLNQRETK